MIFKTSIDKLSRGCGNVYYPEGKGDRGYVCCQMILCPSCQAQLPLLEKLRKQVQDIIEKIKQSDEDVGRYYIWEEELKQKLGEI